MTGRIISIVNRKGGVGKTTLTLALADTIVGEMEQPYNPEIPLVVAVDLDPQASLSQALLSIPKNPTDMSRFRHVIDERQTLGDAIADRMQKSSACVEKYLTHGVGPSGFTYSLFANDATAWDVERRGLRKPGAAKLKGVVRGLLEELAKTYKYVLVDSPPGQTVIAEASIEKSDLILCPIAPDLLSFWGLKSFDEYLKELFDEGKERPPARFVFTKFKAKPPKYNPQNQIYKDVSAFREPINYVTLLKEAGESATIGGQPIALPYDPRLAARLDGAPKLGRRWPWERMYTRATQDALRRLTSAVTEEMNGG